MADPVLVEFQSERTGTSMGVFPWFGLATSFVLLLGWLEGWYGKTAAGDVYGSDAVQYLDIARAFGRGDWHTALNPLWSQGYPALLALLRPALPSGPDGEWWAIRGLNFAIFVSCWLAFAIFVRLLLRERGWSGVTLVGAVCAFVTTQICMDQVSRVGPDQLVAAIFFAVCALLLRMRREPKPVTAAALGVLLGLGFLVKSIFLPLGCCAVLLVAAGLIARRQRLWLAMPAAGLFAMLVAGYGAALSHEVGYTTLGEAGSLNYAWHVNRLAKWVHWEGGVEPADKAWPKPWIARFTRWRSDPPDFGQPEHASERVGAAPAMYVFHAPVDATYAPYFDPPYFYRGYRHFMRWRYEVVALGKNTGDLLQALAKQPFLWAVAVVWLMVVSQREARRRMGVALREQLRDSWPVRALAVAGVAIYLPVHLEGRYLAAFLCVLVVLKLDNLVHGLTGSWAQISGVVLLVGFSLGLVKDQSGVWARALHRWSYHEVLEWREARQLEAEEFVPGSEVGVIGWGPNVQCDWAYLAGLRIVSEIESPDDEKAFWALGPLDRNAVMLRFRQSGATEVITRDKPPEDAAGWSEVGELPMWVYRF
jgi:hypothetical protein